MSKNVTRSNKRVGWFAALGVLAMVGVGYASVPLYRIFCQATGFNGTIRKDIGGEAPGAVRGKLLNIRFDSNVAPGLPWAFKPEKTGMRVAVGARSMAFFTATNEASVPVTGRATFNVTPGQAGGYFTKIECFCFTEQTLKPGETVRMPVVFFVDPKLIDDPEASRINEITLSYTFYPVDSDVAGG
jgi:cytochrome c oxidase assembly protein subunit 11